MLEPAGEAGGIESEVHVMPDTNQTRDAEEHASRPAGADLKDDAKDKPGDPNTGAAAGGGELSGADAFGGFEDDLGRGAD